VRTFKTIEELRTALVAFAKRYNETWLVARHRYKTPAKVRQEQTMPRIARLTRKPLTALPGCLKTVPQYTNVRPQRKILARAALLTAIHRDGGQSREGKNA
jgi:hypothetical protein